MTALVRVDHPRLRNELLRWWPEVLIVALAALARIVLWAIQSGGLYYPDSWWYISALTSHLVGSFHPPGISAIWYLGTLGDATASRVLALQAILGIVACLFLYRALALVLRTSFSLVIAALWAVFPPQLVYERAFLVEAICNDLIIISFWSFCSALHSDKIRLRYFLLLVGLGCLSLVAICAPALDAAVAVFTVASAVLYWRKGRTLRVVRTSTTKHAGLVLAGFVVFVAPIAVLGAVYDHDFGTFSVDPASGSYLFARWSPLVSCTQHGHFTQQAQLVVKDFCQDPFAAIPGNNADNLWSTTTPSLNDSLNSAPNFALTQHQLMSFAEHAIVQHPSQFITQVWDSIFYQVARSDQSGSIAQLTNGSVFTSFAASSKGWSNWYGNAPATSSDYSVSRLIWIAYKTAHWAQYLLWVVLVMFALRVVHELLARMRLRRRSSIGMRTSLVPLEIAIGATALVILQIAEVALASPPDTRYLVTLVPELFLLMALGLPGAAKAKGTPRSI